MAKGSSTLTVLASFNSTDGASPSGPLVLDADGNLYGTTKVLGANGVGTIWEVPSGSNTITVLAPMIGTDGQPEAIGGLVMDGAGNLYGTAVDGGTDSEGSIFELSKGSNTISVLASFNGSNGIGPFGALILDSAGNLYGTAVDGGAWATAPSLSWQKGAVRSPSWPPSLAQTVKRPTADC